MYVAVLVAITEAKRINERTSKINDSNNKCNNKISDRQAETSMTG
jgi:hypothetical protein